MELLQLDDKPAEFKWRDVTFLVRTHVGAGDKFALDTSGHMLDDGGAKFEVWEFYKKLVQLFVVGWTGVTDKGKKVEWDYNTFISRFPSADEDVVMQLGVFIADKTNILGKRDEKLKNG